MSNIDKENKYLEGLNQEQREAVLHKDGPLLIVAGAGTGKTTVITRRLAYLIDQKLAQPQEILALTFTDKAAQEMEERVDQLLPLGYLDLWVSTFHSFCERILKENGLDIGLPTNFKVLDQTAAWLLARQNLNQFKFDYYRPRGNPTRLLHSLITHFSRLKDEGIYPEDYLNYADKLKLNLDDALSTSKFIAKKDKAELSSSQIEAKRIEELANAYFTYQRLLLDNNALDFGDLINYTLRLFKERPQILEKYRNQFKYILVDEFQDTNWAQYELVKLLAEPKRNITVTADDDQSIYLWRGASFNNVLQFKKDYPQSKEVVLIRNYRSCQNILDLAYQFIQKNNPNRLEYQLSKEREIIEEAKEKGLNLDAFKKIDKRLIAQSQGKGFIELLHFADKEAEARGVIDKIEELLTKDKEANLSDFAILVRTNEAANIFCRELERRKIPYQFWASRGLYLQPVILDIIAYLKLIANYQESASMFRILTSPVIDLSYEDISRITQFAKIKTLSLYEALNQLPLIQGISEESINKINFLIALIKKHTQLAINKNVGQVFLAFLNDSGYLKYLLKEEREKEINLINQFYKKIKNFEENQANASLANFIEQLNMEIESGETGALESDIESGPDTINVMTLHAAKGLEFKYVFLVNLADKKFPTIERKEPIEIPEPLIKEIIPTGNIHLQEERRLFYVGMTRAKKGLYFSFADNYGGLRRKKPSRFIFELGFQDQISPLAANQERPEEKKEFYIKKPKQKIILPPYFSFTQFTAFKSCPYQYKLAHILKIPRPGSSSLSFGKTMHNTLYTFLKEVSQKQGNQIDLFKKEAPQAIDFNQLKSRLMEIYKNSWIDEWYLTKEEKEEKFNLGKKILKEFLEDFTKNKPKIKTIKQQLGLELGFYLKLMDNTIKGQIDRIDELEGDEVEIIDYKTGKPKEKLSQDDKEQLLIYQIAAEDVLGLKPKKLTYYYLEENKKLSFSPSQEDKKMIKEKLLDYIEQIKNSDFKPTPGWQCQYCDFKDICEYRKL